MPDRKPCLHGVYILRRAALKTQVGTLCSVTGGVSVLWRKIRSRAVFAWQRTLPTR